MTFAEESQVGNILVIDPGVLQGENVSLAAIDEVVIKPVQCVKLSIMAYLPNYSNQFFKRPRKYLLSPNLKNGFKTRCLRK